MNKKIILITGGSSGIGRACSEYLANKGHIVFATTRKDVNYKERSFGIGTLTLITLDVTKQNTINEAIKYILSKYKRIDVVVNNAGFGIAGAIEDVSYEEALSQFDVNFFGTINVIKTILPIFREQKQGQIINIGSVAGYVSLPFQAMYSASKSAILSYTKALRNEVKPFNIKVTIIEPGDIKTNFTNNRQVTKKSDNDSIYKDRFIKSIEVMANDEKNGSEPIVIAKAVDRVINQKHPAIAITVGIKYKLFKLLFRLLPEKVSEYAVYLLYGK